MPIAAHTDILLTDIFETWRTRYNSEITAVINLLNSLETASHPVNADVKLANGTANEVSAAELRNFLDTLSSPAVGSTNLVGGETIVTVPITYSANTGQLLVIVNGAVLRNGVDFTEQATTITASEELPSGFALFINLGTGGSTAYKAAGITADRPTGPPVVAAGTLYFDTTLGLPIWWNGTIWINADGTAA